MKLILIHGRAQEKKEAKLLQLMWTDALRQGLKKSNLSLPPEVEIVFPYYGDLLDNLVQQAGLPSAEEVVARGSSDGNEKELEFYAEFLSDLVENAGITDAEIDRHFKGSVARKGVRNWEWLQAILEVMDDLNILSNYSIKKATYDVFLYLTIKGISKKVNEFVASAIDTTPCVVVGHSLGSVVGYNVLKNAPQLQVQQLITIGSPLGIKSIHKHLEPPLGMPACVKGGWFNAYDERDIVALKPLDKAPFITQPPIENNNRINNRSSQRHDAEAYLEDPTVAKRILEALLAIKP